MQIRKISLDDTAAISGLCRRSISVWQRMAADGQVTDVSYDELNIYERWLHGGAWMSVETGAIYLNHTISYNNIVLAAVQQGEIVGYAEAYPGSEPEPFGHHLHLAVLISQDESARDALVRSLLDYSKSNGFERLTVSFSAYDAESAEFYIRYNMQPIATSQRYTLSARTGQGFYKVQEHPDPDPAQIEGWYMTAGRLQSARYHWLTLWPQLWQSVEQMAARPTFRLSMNAAGHDALVYLQRQLYDPRSVDVYCWSPRPLTPQLLTALRDWVHRQNYRTLVLDIPADKAKILGSDAETSPYQQATYAVDVI